MVCGGWSHRVGGGFNTHVFLVIGIDVLEQTDERNTCGPYLSASHSGMSSSTVTRTSKQNKQLASGGRTEFGSPAGKRTRMVPRGALLERRWLFTCL